MGFLRKLISILFFLLIIGAALYFAGQKGWLKGVPVLENIDQTLNPELLSSTQDQAQVLGERAGEVNSHVQNVLGSYVQKNDEEVVSSSSSGVGGTDEEQKPLDSVQDKPFYQETLEYGRYLYCQQVVKDYESRD